MVMEKAKEIDFYDLYWHDSVVKNILINRTEPGVIDTITFEIKWPDNQLKFLVFEDVYWADLNLNFGFHGSDTIYDADILGKDDPDIVNFYARHKGHLDHIKLIGYCIISNSMIKILAKGFKLMESI